MAIPTGRARLNCVGIADQFDSLCTNMLVSLQALRDAINTNSAADGLQTQLNVANITGLQMWVQTNVLARPQADQDAIIAAYKLRFSGITTFNPATDWPAANTTMNAFVTWFKTNWPHTATGYIFVNMNGSNNFVSISVAISGATKTTVLGQLDAILAAFT